MGDILDRFIATARESITDGYYGIVPGSVPGSTDLPRLSLKQKLLSQDFSLITEIKHASPAGDYEFGEIDAHATAAEFKESGSDAISIVVEPKIFRGNLKDMPLAKRAGLPILFKDFILEDVQIKAARNAGADAVLLVVKVAKREGLDLEALITTAHREGLEVLLESYNAEELKQAMKTDADILGINNRDLRTLHVDIRTTERILKEVHVDRPLISESGIRTAGDVRFARKAGVKGILVGTAIWTAPDIKAKIRELKMAGGTADA